MTVLTFRQIEQHRVRFLSPSAYMWMLMFFGVRCTVVVAVVFNSIFHPSGAPRPLNFVFYLIRHLILFCLKCLLHFAFRPTDVERAEALCLGNSK